MIDPGWTTTGRQGRCATGSSEAGGPWHSALKMDPPTVVNHQARLSERVQVVRSVGKAEDDGEHDDDEQDEQPQQSDDDPQQHCAILTHSAAKWVDAGPSGGDSASTGPVIHLG